MTLDRKSGVLLHVTSLPSPFGIGDLGPGAYRFIDQLSEHGFSVWQILPLGPNGPGNSPYQAYSAYAGDHLFISPDKLKEWGLVTDEDMNKKPAFKTHKVDFPKVSAWKKLLLKKACDHFYALENGSFKHEYQRFVDEHGWWLADYALFMACKERFDDSAWNEWPDGLAKREAAALEQYRLLLTDEIKSEMLCQFFFFKQWFELKTYANNKGVEIFGDLPLYVAFNSSDVWSNQAMFMLGADGKPTLVGGVPPDYFSEDGQLWGNPLFDWAKLKEVGYHWWMARFYFNFHLFNLVRIDHFRGLEAFWAIPSHATTAKEGQWMPANGFEMLDILIGRLGNLPIVAEDLGIITPEVETLRDHFGLPGMKVLQFAFTSDYKNIHLPHNFPNNCLAYTGTHDNSTLVGWWAQLNGSEKELASLYVNHESKDIHKEFIELIWSSCAKLAIVPVQDIMGLGDEARMNTPGTPNGNWGWRLDKRLLKPSDWKYMKMLNEKYNRL
jgi:4-alpha-glucanotransferase